MIYHISRLQLGGFFQYGLEQGDERLCVLALGDIGEYASVLRMERGLTRERVASHREFECMLGRTSEITLGFEEAHRGFVAARFDSKYAHGERYSMCRARGKRDAVW